MSLSKLIDEPFWIEFDLRVSPLIEQNIQNIYEKSLVKWLLSPKGYVTESSHEYIDLMKPDFLKIKKLLIFYSISSALRKLCSRVSWISNENYKEMYFNQINDFNNELFQNENNLEIIFSILKICIEKDEMFRTPEELSNFLSTLK